MYIYSFYVLYSINIKPNTIIIRLKLTFLFFDINKTSTRSIHIQFNSIQFNYILLERTQQRCGPNYKHTVTVHH